jgi:hypothetical protein
VVSETILQYLDVPGHMRIHIAQQKAEELARSTTIRALRAAARDRGLPVGGSKREVAWHLVQAPSFTERCRVCGTLPCQYVDALPVTPIQETGWLVRHPHRLIAEAEARGSLMKYLRKVDAYEPDEATEYVATLKINPHRVFRWNPCNQHSCYEGGGHCGHIDYLDRHPDDRPHPRGAFLAMLLEHL